METGTLTTDRPARLPVETRLGAVHLTISDLDRSIGWYQDTLGLRVNRRDDQSAALGDVVVLHENPSARPSGRTAGLYHYALLFPSREELARCALRLAVTRTPIQGASDHGTHEAIYLPDPDGIGIELAADRPRAQWPDLAYLGGPAPLDLEGLLETVADEEPRCHAAAGLAIGHVHLHVGDLAAATSFYRDSLGFDVMTDLGSAVFVSAGGYHHHVAFNVWQGRGAPPAPLDAVGLRHWTLLLPSGDDVEAVRRRLDDIEEGGNGFIARDPSGIAVRVTTQ